MACGFESRYPHQHKGNKMNRRELLVGAVVTPIAAALPSNSSLSSEWVENTIVDSYLIPRYEHIEGNFIKIQALNYKINILDQHLNWVCMLMPNNKISFFYDGYSWKQVITWALNVSNGEITCQHI